MPEFALFTAVETGKFKENLQCRCRVQSPRKRQENDDIMEKVAAQKGFMGNAAKARALWRKEMNAPGGQLLLL